MSPGARHQLPNHPAGAIMKPGNVGRWASAWERAAGKRGERAPGRTEAGTSVQDRPSPGAAPHPPQTALHRDARCLPAYGLLDNIRSVWNVGSIFRTADAVALAGLFLCGMTATPPRADMEKTALGATLSVPWDYWQDPGSAVTALRSRSIQVVALERTAGAIPYDQCRYAFPVCFVVGHERRGVSPAVLRSADRLVEIPMRGRKESLNVAVSFGILAYEILRQWSARPAAGPPLPACRERGRGGDDS
jgi:tRNA(Leu) C34 or U34 (ribose-2'-O)-methylase TrmL